MLIAANITTIDDAIVSAAVAAAMRGQTMFVVRSERELLVLPAADWQPWDRDRIVYVVWPPGWKYRAKVN